jgi:hypothetical protein
VSQHYTWGHHERLPYDERAVKSVYHVRELEVHRLMQVRTALFEFVRVCVNMDVCAEERVSCEGAGGAPAHAGEDGSVLFVVTV